MTRRGPSFAIMSHAFPFRPAAALALCAACFAAPAQAVFDLFDTDNSGLPYDQVNALAVYQMGEIAFGRPSRITAETYMGRHGLINIEREARLSGRTHDKGVLILSGYLGRTFAQKFPLTLSISITFDETFRAESARPGRSGDSGNLP